MILVFGGTTEGKQVIKSLNSLAIPFVYTTKTKIEAQVGEHGTYRSGVLDYNSLKGLIIEENIKLIIHASHPFAEVLHTTIAQVALDCKLPVYRLERSYPKRIVSENIQYVSSYQKLLEVLHDQFFNKKGLFLTGVQTIARLSDFWKNNTSYFRILDRELSINMALQSNFPKEYLILGMPNKNVEDEVDLIQKIGAQFLVTKESGESGSLSVKIKAAQQCNIPVFIIEKPVLPESFKMYSSIEELSDVLKSECI